MFQGSCNDIIQRPIQIPRAPHNIGQYRGPASYWNDQHNPCFEGRLLSPGPLIIQYKPGLQGPCQIPGTGSANITHISEAHSYPQGPS